MNNVLTPFNWQAELQKVETDSIGNDFIMFENHIIRPVFDFPFKLDVTVAIICVKGMMRGTVNLKQYTLESPCLFIVLSEQIMQYENISDDFSGLFIMMSDKFLTNLSIDIHERVPLFLSVHDNPSIPLNDEELKSTLDYYKMLQKAVRATDNPYRLEIVKHLTQAFFYGSGLPVS